MDKKFSYQPDIATSVICWSFTLMIFLLSMLLWLEITVLQPWTIITFIIFILIFVLQVRSRKIELGQDQFILNKVIKTNNEAILYADVLDVTTTTHKLMVKTQHNQYEFLMKKKNVNELAAMIKNNMSAE